MPTNLSYRILMFAPYFPPWRGAEATVNAKLALAFLRRGWEVDVVSFPVPKWDGEWEREDLWGPLRDRTHVAPQSLPGAVVRMLSRGIGLLRTRHPVAGVAWARYALASARRLMEGKSYDLILSRSRPIEAHLPALAISSRLGIPWIANWNDPEPPSRNMSPYGDGPGARIGLWWERYLRCVSSSASCHTFPSERLKGYMERIYPGMRGRSFAIPHLALSDLSPKPPAGRGKEFLLCHAGALERQRSPENLFHAFSLFLSRGGRPDPIRLLLLGNDLSGLPGFSLPNGLGERIEMSRWCSYMASLRRISESSVGLVVEAPCKEGIFLPSKFVEYVQVGRPVLAVSPRVGTLSDLIGRYGGGVAADCTSPREIADALEALYGSWRGGSLDRDFPTQMLYDLFREEAVLDQYEETFARIVVRGRGTGRKQGGSKGRGLR